MFERFSRQARAVVIGASDESRQLGHGHVGTEHLLLALLGPQAGAASGVLKEAGLDRARVRPQVERLGERTGQLLGEDDAAALHAVGIDLEAVLAKIEERFGPQALRSPPPPAGRRLGVLRRRPRRGRFTRRAKKVLELALREALALDDDHIRAEHILLGLLRDGSGQGARILGEAGVDLVDLRRATLEAMRRAA